MVYKFALTSTGPLSGKTTLAEYLRDQYGFMVASHSNTIVEGYVADWNASHVSTISVPYVYANKEAFRQDLQTWGNTSGFNDPEKCILWVRKTLADWLQYTPARDVVFSETRGEGQAQVLRDLGFEIIQLHITEDEREYRAIQLGRDYEQIVKSMVAHPELELGIAQPDISLNAELSVEVLARVLLDRPKKFKGYTIYGNEVRSRC